jgi:hypothetical protein
MRIKFVVWFVGLLFLCTGLMAQAPPHVVAAETTDAWASLHGTDLFSKCTAAKDTEDFTECVFYIEGAIDMIGGIQASYEPATGKSYWRYATVCMPLHANGLQTVDVVLKYMKDNPEGRADKASSIIIRALLKAWKCPAS